MLTCEEIEARSVPVPHSGCWLWLGSIFADKKHGYGDTGIPGLRSAHRASWEAFNRRSAAGRMVLHRCDVRLCVNPDHLYLGDHLQNMRDMVVRGRSCRRLRHAIGKLSFEDAENVRKLVAEGKSSSEIAEQFRVSKTVIRDIARGLPTWSRDGLKLPQIHFKKPLPTACPQGHRLEGDNLYTAPNGTIACFACRRARSAAFNAKVSAAKKSAGLGRVAADV